MFHLEREIKNWLRLFRKHRAFNHGTIREMELHLRDHIEDLIAGGHNQQEAFELAVKEFGAVPEVAKEEFWIIKSKTTFRSIIHTTMLRNYAKTTLRSLMKNPVSSFINLFGLSVAIGICIVVFSFIKWDYSIDRFHVNENEVYLTTFFADREGGEIHYGMTPRPLGDLLKQDFAHVKKMCRIEDRSAVLKYEKKVFSEQIRYADPEFLEMFTFPLKWGAASSLYDLNSIVLSENMSIKYFGNDNPVGKDILMVYEDNRSKAFKVSGVAEAFPKAHIIEFDFLVNFQNINITDSNFDFNDWTQFVGATLIQVDNASDIDMIENGMDKYLTLQNEANHDWSISSFHFEQLATLRENSVDMRNGISNNYTGPGRIVLPILALFMLLLACFNYINISIVSAAKRLKEIGVRKVMGANRGRVIIQFLTENLVISFFALVIGAALGMVIFLPWFKELSGLPLELKLSDKNLFIFLLSVLFFTGIASGIYPAIYISKFNAVKIFKGSVKFGKKNPLTKIFLGIQLILACITVTGGVMFTQNTHYINNQSWGYNQKGALYVNVPDKTAFDKLHNILSQNADVLSMSGSTHHLGKSAASTIVHMPERQYEVHQLSVDADYFKTMEIELREGRVFKDNFESDRRTVVVNDLLVKKLSLDKPIGQKFEIDSIKYEIIGVVKDFHMYNFFNELRPTIFKLADEGDYHYLSLRVRSGVEKDTYESIQTQWATLFPEIPFQGEYQEDTWNGFYEEVAVQERFMKVVAFIAILLASLGLYGLVSLNVSGRIREFSIRKTLGAGIKNIAVNITKQYLILSAVALVLGAPISYLLMRANLDMLYPSPMPIGYSGVAIAIIILITVLLTVVSTQITKVTMSNPVDGLKEE